MMTNPLPSHGELYLVISQEEKQKSVSSKIVSMEPSMTLWHRIPRYTNPQT